MAANHFSKYFSFDLLKKATQKKKKKKKKKKKTWNFSICLNNLD